MTVMNSDTVWNLPDPTPKQQRLIDARIACPEAGYPLCESRYGSVLEYKEATTEASSVMREVPQIGTVKFDNYMTIINNLNANAKVVYNTSMEQIEIYPTNGGLIVCPLIDCDFDSAPWCD